MAIFTAGPLAATISGSIAGTTFSRNRGGTYMRNRAIPLNPNTSFQLNVRSIFATQSQAWADQTAAVRAAWSNWAVQNPVINALGRSIILSGAQAFIQIRSRLQLAGDVLIVNPPIVNAPDGLLTLAQTTDIGTGNFQLAFTTTPLPSTVSLWILAAVVNSAGITYVRNLLRFIGQSADTQVSPFDHQSLVETRFGTLLVGQTVHVHVSTFSNATGLLSTPLETSTVVIDTP